MLVFVIHNENENCCINNSRYPVECTTAATPLRKGSGEDSNT